MSHVQCCIQKFFFHDCLRFVFFITEFIWINKQSQSIFDMQNPTDGIVDIFHTDFTGFYQFFQGENWKSAIMLVIACVLLFLGIVKKFEPLLLVPIAIGMLVTNLPGAGMFHEILFAGGHVHWELFGGQPITASFLSEMLNSGVSADVLQPYADSLWTAAQSMFGADALSQVAAQVAAATGDAVNSIAVQIQTLASAEQFAAASGLTMSNVTVSVGLVDVLYLGIKLGIYPCLIFMGVGAMTDFGPLIANPKSLLLGAAAQLGIFLTYLGCRLLGFTGAESSSVGIIGGADGPTAIFVTTPAWTRPAWMAALLIIGVVGYLLLRRCKAKSK